MTTLQLLFLSAPTIICVWLLLWFLSLALVLRFMETEKPVYVLAIKAVDRIRELYEIGIVCAFAALAVHTLN